MDPVQIGAREIYDAVQGLRREVAAIQGELDRQGDRQAGVVTRLDGQEARLEDVERRVWALPAPTLVLAVLAVGVSTVGLIIR